MNELLTIALLAAGGGQLLVATLNLFLPRLLGWREPLAQMPQLMREVFQVHVWFISITLAIFGVVTLRFARELGASPMGRWLAAGIGLFWAVRALVQVVFYSSSHWRGQLGRTAIHIILLTAYGGMAATYLLTAWR